MDTARLIQTAGLGSTTGLEPNPHPGRSLNASFFNDLIDHLRFESAAGRSAGVLEASAFKGLRCIAPGVVSLENGISAIGERGFVIDASGIKAIKPLDIESIGLNPGSHRVWACRAERGNPFGPETEEPAPDHSNGSTRYRPYLRPRVVLCVGDARFDHMDWIAVGVVKIEQPGSRVKVSVDPAFYPPLRSMADFHHKNPFVELADRLLDSLPARGDSIVIVARAELNVLRQLAPRATPELVYAQFLRCLTLVGHRDPLAGSLQIRFGGDGSFFDPLEFGCVSAELSEALSQEFSEERFPRLIRIDGEECLRLETVPEFDDVRNVWAWRRPVSKQDYRFNKLVMYFPARPSTAVEVEESPARSDAPPVIQFHLPASDWENHAVARQTQACDPYGWAVVLEENLDKEFEEILLDTDGGAAALALAARIGDGCAFYYS